MSHPDSTLDSADRNLDFTMSTNRVCSFDSLVVSVNYRTSRSLDVKSLWSRVFRVYTPCQTHRQGRRQCFSTTSTPPTTRNGNPYRWMTYLRRSSTTSPRSFDQNEFQTMQSVFLTTPHLNTATASRRATVRQSICQVRLFLPTPTQAGRFLVSPEGIGTSSFMQTILGLSLSVIVQAASKGR
jgi:hypothetical protein